MVPLAAYLEEGAEVHCREKPEIDGAVLEAYAAFVAGKCPTEW